MLDNFLLLVRLGSLFDVQLDKENHDRLLDGLIEVHVLAEVPNELLIVLEELGVTPLIVLQVEVRAASRRKDRAVVCLDLGSGEVRLVEQNLFPDLNHDGEKRA